MHTREKSDFSFGMFFFLANWRQFEQTKKSGKYNTVTLQAALRKCAKPSASLSKLLVRTSRPSQTLGAARLHLIYNALERYDGTELINFQLSYNILKAPPPPQVL